MFVRLTDKKLFSDFRTPDAWPRPAIPSTHPWPHPQLSGFTGDDDLSVTIGYLADFSSIGPSYDLRYKPDVVSPGKFLLSADAVGYEGG